MAASQTFEQWLQSRLTAHGFAVGPIDGVIGDLTRAALRAFERRHKLPEDAIADPRVVELLRLPASGVPTTVAKGLPDRDRVEAAPVVKTLWPRQAGVPAYYGNVGAHQTMVVLPFEMRIAWGKKLTIQRISLHEKVADSAVRCFERIADAYDEAQRRDLGIDLFGGSLNVRRMRGGSSWSMHSWGIAIDFDPERNQLKWGRDRARLGRPDAEAFWRIWEDEGWVSLGRAKNYDWMHVQAARP